MLEASAGKFTYDSANRLITADTRYYAYDVEGTRISTQRGEDVTKFTYNVNARLSQLLVMTENNAETKYVYGLGLIGEEVSGNFKTYHFDYRGSTVAITNSNGTVTDTFEYDTYGKLTARTGTTKTPFLYNGRDGVMYEDDTGLIYMRARYYCPTLRRFVNADVIAGSIDNSATLNRYAYCNGNPVSYADPFGLSADDARGNQSNGGIDISSWYTEDVSNAIHNILDIAGFIPGFGAFSDALNSIVYALEGDWYNAGMSALAVIPGLGDMAKGFEKASKLFRKSGKIYKALNSASKFISKIDDVLDSIASISKVDDILGFSAKNGDEVVEQLAKNVDMVPNSKVLRKNMIDAGIKVPDYNNAAHHIVAGRAPDAEEARQILKKFGIGINDANNGVFLSTVKGVGGTYHPSMHTIEYYVGVNQKLRVAQSGDDVITILNKIGKSL